MCTNTELPPSRPSSVTFLVIFHVGLKIQILDSPTPRKLWSDDLDRGATYASKLVCKSFTATTGLQIYAPLAGVLG